MAWLTEFVSWLFDAWDAFAEGDLEDAWSCLVAAGAVR